MLQRLDLRGRGPDFRGALPRPNLADEGPVAEVRAIVDDVRVRGDAALREYTARFDMVDLDEIRVPPSEIASSPGRLDPALLAALTEAAEAIESFHRHRPGGPGTFERNGISVELLELPVARAGVYVPGGLASYPSSVLMTAIPARVAGVEGIAVCVPPAPDGAIPVEVLAAASLAGVDEIYRVGGPQAIAAMAYGTETVAPRRCHRRSGEPARVARQAGGREAPSACRLRSPGPPRSSSSPTSRSRSTTWPSTSSSRPSTALTGSPGSSPGPSRC